MSSLQLFLALACLQLLALLSPAAAVSSDAVGTGVNENENEDENQCLNEDWSTLPKISARDELAAHTAAQWPEGMEIITVIADHLYVATGYGIANIIFVETDSGIVVIDVGGISANSARALADYRQQRRQEMEGSDPPLSTDKLEHIQAIILTHNHADHSMGLPAFLAEPNSADAAIYVQADVIPKWKHLLTYTVGAELPRSARMFGYSLQGALLQHVPPLEAYQKQYFLNIGIGPYISPPPIPSNTTYTNTLPFERMTLVTEKSTQLTYGGLQIELILAPGETDDQMIVWIESLHALMPGDNFYQAFPNLYTIRGTTARDPKSWIDSLDLIRTKKSQFLVGSHTRPTIDSADRIAQELTLYRDGIAFVHDQTVRHLNKFSSLEDIIAVVESTMPPYLRQGPLFEFYGTVEWSVRATYDLYVGWFQGDAAQLYPSSSSTKGQAFNELFQFLYRISPLKNVKSMVPVIVKYLKLKVGAAQLKYFIGCKKNTEQTNCVVPEVALPEERWALEVVTWLSTQFKHSADCAKDSDLAMLSELRWSVMRKIAGRSISANGRNYMLAQWLEEEYGLFSADSSGADAAALSAYVPMAWIMEGFRYKIAPENVIGQVPAVSKVIYQFTDSGACYLLHIRHGGVLAVDEYCVDTDGLAKIEDAEDIESAANVILQMTELQFKLGGVFNPAFIVQGDVMALFGFFQNFDLGQAQALANSELDVEGNLFAMIAQEMAEMTATQTETETQAETETVGESGSGSKSEENSALQQKESAVAMRVAAIAALILLYFY